MRRRLPNLTDTHSQGFQGVCFWIFFMSLPGVESAPSSWKVGGGNRSATKQDKDFRDFV